MDYGFVHEGKVFTPNGSTSSDPSKSDARNKAIEAQELAAWSACPDGMLAYYDTKKGVVTTWLGTVTGIITEHSVYRHNFGGRFISLRVTGTNGATYCGRASYDWGTCVKLRRVKGRRTS